MALAELVKRRGGSKVKRTPYKNGMVSVIVKPGDAMPRGYFHMGWKLDPSRYGPGTMYFVILPDEDV